MNNKIVFFLPDLRAGGAERIMLNLLNQFNKNTDLSITLLLAQKAGPLMDQVPENIEIYNLNSSSARNSVMPLIRFCRQHKPDLIFATLGSCLAVSMARPFISGKIKVLSRLGNTIGAEKLLIHNWAKKQMYLFANWLIGKFSDGVIFQCNYMADDYIRETRLKPDTYTVIYNPVDVEKAENLASEKISLSYDMVAVGRLNPQKDYPTLISACKILKDRQIDFTLAILGDGNLMKQLSGQIGDAELQQQVFLLGYVKNPYPYIQSSKYLVSSSLYEGFSNVIVEALCLGTPVIATDCPGGNNETINPGINGYLCKMGNPVELADQMEIALKERTKFNSARIKEAGIEKFRLPVIAAKYEQVLRVMLDSRKKSTV